MTPITDAIKPSMNKFFFGKRGDRTKLGKGSDTRCSGVSCFQTNRVPGIFYRKLAGKDGREKVCYVRVPFANESLVNNEHVLLQMMCFQPAYLDSKLLTGVVCTYSSGTGS